ncbi:MAG: PBP1A family penicillin-binding protein [Patescibacteria group bacterium]|jgi:1A family penicillin-binding protein
MTIPKLSPVNQNWRTPSYLPKGKTSNVTFTSGSNGHKRKKKWPKKLLSILIPLFVILFLIGGIFSIAMMAWVSKDLPNANGVLNRNVTVSSRIYERSGQTVLYDLHGDIKRTLIPLSEIPDYAQKATISVEDRNFYKGKGFSITGIIRSVLKNIFTGSKVGGSTLTQQFVKNAILTNEKTYTRKIKELIISYRIEKKFSKDEILSMYFNEIPYGSVVYGIEAASQTFFGKPAKDLTLAEAAILAAIPQAPTYYSPYGSHKDKLIARQRYVLDSMTQLGYITKDQAEAAKQQKIIFKPQTESMTAPHFVMYIKELLSQQYGEDFINQQGLKIYTTLDLDKQKIAEKSVTDGVKANGTKYNFTNASLVAMDPKTGQILAMVGSADYFDEDIDGQVNVALRPRQPGSSFKPIVYTASFIKGYTPDTIIYDVVTNFDKTGVQKYEPHNYNGKELGPVTLRKALAGSLNIPAVKLTYLTGINNIIDLAEKMGYTTFADRSRFGLSIVLGGGEVKLLEHVNAYGVLAQEGIKHEINPILKIEDKDGHVLYEYKDKNSQVMDQEITRLTTSILSDNAARTYIFGANNKLILPDRPVAAKTGTTNDYHDAWTMGYTPSLVCGVWVGNSNNDVMKKGADGSIIAAPIWNQFMQEALKDTPAEQFTAPQPIITGKPILDGQINGGQMIKIDTISGKLATEYTPSSTIQEIYSGAIHDILFFVDKDNPRGPALTDPASDPQYNNWENAVALWASKNDLTQSSSSIPTTYDDVHLPEDKPIIDIISPAANSTIKDSDLKIQVSASAKKGIAKINYYLDKKLLGTKTSAGESIFDVSSFENGYHTLTVEAQDSLQNFGSKSIDINLLLQNHRPSLDWLSPADGSKIKLPTKISAKLSNWTNVNKIDFYYMKEGETLGNFINYIEPDNENISINWVKKSTDLLGNYTVYANIFDTKGQKYVSDQLKIIIQ